MAHKLMLHFKELHYHTASIQCMPIHDTHNHQEIDSTLNKHMFEHSPHHPTFTTNLIKDGFHYTMDL